MAARPSSAPQLDESLALLERRPDGVTLVTLNRPKMNALSRELLSRLDDLVDDLQADLPGAVVVWGGGRVFSAGAEVSELARPGAAAEVTRAFHALTARIAALPRVTVAAINGYALGGGLELALACDFRVVAADARLGQPEILLGIIPGGGATQRLPRLVGAARAKDLIFTGRQVQADEALGMGLADRVAPRAEVLEAALALAAQMAAGPHLARAAAKRIIDEGAGLPMSRALELEAAAFVSVFGTEDARLGIESFLRHGPGRALFVGR